MFVLAGPVIFTACNAGPTAPTVGLSEEFVLAHGELAQVESPRLSVRFVEVTGDSSALWTFSAFKVAMRSCISMY